MLARYGSRGLIHLAHTHPIRDVYLRSTHAGYYVDMYIASASSLLDMSQPPSLLRTAICQDSTCRASPPCLVVVVSPAGLKNPSSSSLCPKTSCRASRCGQCIRAWVQCQCPSASASMYQCQCQYHCPGESSHHQRMAAHGQQQERNRTGSTSARRQ